MSVQRGWWRLMFTKYMEDIQKWPSAQQGGRSRKGSNMLVDKSLRQRASCRPWTLGRNRRCSYTSGNAQHLWELWYGSKRAGETGNIPRKGRGHNFHWEPDIREHRWDWFQRDMTCTVAQGPTRGLMLCCYCLEILFLFLYWILERDEWKGIER